MGKYLVRGLLASAAFCLTPGQANAVIIGGVDFPQGAISFADSVVSYLPGLEGASPTAPHQGAVNALDVPDYAGGNGCASIEACTFVSLGVGGQLVVRFDNNILTGSDSDAFDLWIFEIGPDVEDTTVELSNDGQSWVSAGFVTGNTRGVDIDFFGFGSNSAFSYVRLTDVAGEGDTSGVTVGADIDAVGAISTRAVVPPVPEPATWAMMIIGIGGVGLSARARKRRDALRVGTA